MHELLCFFAFTTFASNLGSMKKYRHLFFDLDRTLWDFEANSEETLRELYSNHHLQRRGIPTFESFKNTYRAINKALWQQYKYNEISKQHLRVERFKRTLKYFTINDITLAEKLGEEYISISPTKTRLFPNVHETLQYLATDYIMHILTNGFNEVQFVKLEKSGLRKYFDTVITSENAGSKKPDQEIFRYALEQTAARKTESLVIGDDPESDIQGAADAGIDQVFVNYINISNGMNPTYEVTDLSSLRDFL